MTWPSLRTSLLVETPTLAVCGAVLTSSRRNTTNERSPGVVTRLGLVATRGSENEGEADSAQREIAGADQAVHRRLAGGDGADGESQKQDDYQQGDRQEGDGRKLAPPP